MNRRDFLKTSSTAAAVVLLSSLPAFTQATDSKQRTLAPITIRYDGMNIIDNTIDKDTGKPRGKPLGLPAGTKIQLPNLYSKTPDNETFLMADENGIATMPKGTIFILPTGEKKTYPKAAFKANHKGVDFYHVISGVEAYKGDRTGAIFPIDADSGFVHVKVKKNSHQVAPGKVSENFTKAGQLNIAHSLAFFAQYDLTYDLANMTPALRAKFTTYHRNDRPIMTSNADNMRARNDFVNHIELQHHVPVATMNRGYQMATYVIKNRTPEQNKAEAKFVPAV